MMKFIFVMGGVVSGFGKGIISVFIGMFFKVCGFRMMNIKIDFYFNYDVGMMNFYQYGEVFVFDDGGEVDFDFGNYECFLDISLSFDYNIIIGKVYFVVIEKECKGEYFGVIVQVILYIINEIKECIRRIVRDYDVVVVEIGGMVGDIESMFFFEVVRQMQIEEGRENVVFVYVIYVFRLRVVGEQKIKLIQYSVKELCFFGIQFDVIVVCLEDLLEDLVRRKISLFINVLEEVVISVYDVEDIYEVFLMFEKEGLFVYFVRRFGFFEREFDLEVWCEMVEKYKFFIDMVEIVIVGKYVKLVDFYLSIKEVLKYFSVVNDVKVKIRWIEVEDVERQGVKFFEGVDGIIVFGGFGVRGIEGKMMVIRYVRENNILFFGICFGFQFIVVEFVCNVFGFEGVYLIEIDFQIFYLVVDLMLEQRDFDRFGGIMRFGVYLVYIKLNIFVRRFYGREIVYERYCYCWEVNLDYVEKFEEVGFVFSGIVGDDERRMEIFEFLGYSYFIVIQFYLEFKLRLMRLVLVFRGFVEVVKKKKYGS